MSSSCHFPDAQALQSLLEARVDEQRAGGIAVGVVEADGTTRVAAYGDPGPGALPLGPDSVFEIGSVTKTFTGVLLADMAARGEVDPDVPAQRYAPPGLILPMRGGRAITLTDLATHTSGLPRLPGNLSPRNPSNPYADYTVAMLYEFLAGCELPRAIGSTHEYSNLGMGLLGHLLAARAGAEFGSARALIDPTLPTRAPALAGDAVVVSADVLERYVGDYEYRPAFRRTATLTVTLEDGVLMIEGDGSGRTSLAAESERRFFAGGAALTFVTDSSGTTTGLVLDRGRFSRTVKKVR